MLFRTTEGLRNPTDFSFLLCLDGGVAESWGVTGVLGGTSWEFFTKGWVRHLGQGSPSSAAGRSMSKVRWDRRVFNLSPPYFLLS